MPDITALTPAEAPLRVETAPRPPFLGEMDSPRTAHPSGAATPWSRDNRDPLEVFKLDRKLRAVHAQVIDRMAAQPEGTEIILWSAGNVRVGDRDLTMQIMDAVLMYGSLRKDKRFTRSKLKYFDDEGHDWKIVYHRNGAEAAGLDDEHHVTQGSEP